MKQHPSEAGAAEDASQSFNSSTIQRAAERPNSASAHTTSKPPKFSMKDMLIRAPLQ
jgi:hypothetical protein